MNWISTRSLLHWARPTEDEQETCLARWVALCGFALALGTPPQSVLLGTSRAEATSRSRCPPSTRPNIQMPPSSFETRTTAQLAPSFVLEVKFDRSRNTQTRIVTLDAKPPAFPPKDKFEINVRGDISRDDKTT